MRMIIITFNDNHTFDIVEKTIDYGIDRLRVVINNPPTEAVRYAIVTRLHNLKRNIDLARETQFSLLVVEAIVKNELEEAYAAAISGISAIKRK